MVVDKVGTKIAAAVKFVNMAKYEEYAKIAEDLVFLNMVM